MTRLDVPPPAPEAATDGLARDSELLSAALNEVLEEQAGRVFASRLQWLFSTAAAVRDGRRGGGRAARRAICTGVPDESVEPIIRACSLRAAAREHRRGARARRGAGASTTRPARSQRESLAETARDPARSRRRRRAAGARQLQIEHVLTAHPTEATRRSVLDHQWDVAALLDRLDDPRTGHARRRALLDELREVLTALVADRRAAPRRARASRTRSAATCSSSRPTLFDAVPGVLGEIEHALGVAARCSPCWPTARWTGGDMDGHPEVGADTLARALRLHRSTALRLLRDRVRPPGAARSRTRSLRVPVVRRSSSARSSATRRSCPQRRRAAPPAPRVGAAADQARLRRPPARQHAARRAGASRATRTRRRCARDLELVLAHLGSGTSRCGAIRRLLWQVDVFGFHLASIDIRQGAGVVREATGALLPGLRATPTRAAPLRRCSTEALARARGAASSTTPAARPGELLRVLDTVALAADAYGPQRGAGVRDLDDRAAVRRARRALARPARAGATLAADGAAVRDARALEQAPATMAELYACEPYRRRTCARTATARRVMVGYSDSGKDTGFVARQWALLQRAGAARVRRPARPASRSSSSTAAAARPRAAAGAPTGRSWPSPRAPCRGGSGITEQGETVSARYADPELAVRSLEQTVSAVLLATALPEPAGPRRVARGDGAAGRSARASATARWSTTTRTSCASSSRSRRSPSSAQLNIGSRPPSRKGIAAGVESLRAIPWVFAWTQNRLLLPSWYGAGTALAAGDARRCSARCGATGRSSAA